MIHCQPAENIGQDSTKKEYLSFGSADFHSDNFTCSCKAISCMLEPNSEEASRTESSAENNQLILHLPMMTNSSVQLSLFIQFM